MKIKLGIAPIAWSNDDMPELGGDTPIEKCLDDAKKSGFTGIFAASLELTKEGEIKILQKKMFEKIMIKKIVN